jgi:TRAP transporter TAXI family solute receptor
VLRRSAFSLARFSSALSALASTWGILAVLAGAGFVLAYRYVGAPPPKIVRIATGTLDGAYYRYGQRYAEILAQDGITLEVVSTSGSIENLMRLRTGDVSLAFVQSGCATDADRAQLQSLGSLFAEPVWVLAGEATAISRLADLRTRRVAVGVPRSGTQVLATQMLAANGVTASNATLLETGPTDTHRLLREGAADAAILVASPDAPFIRHLLEEPGIKLLDLERATAYGRRFAFLTPVTLSEGVIDLQRDIPSHDTRLVAAAAYLAARTDLNASLIPAVLNAVTRVHRGEGLLESTREFPSTELADVPVNDDAARYIRNGPSLLYRWLPYRTAVLLDRIKVLALPFVALLLPLFRIGPPLYQWRVRSRIYRWYADVRAIDARLRAESIGDRESVLRQLKELDRDVASISVPLAYAGELYHLRLHIRLLQEELTTRRAQRPTSPPNSSVTEPEEPEVHRRLSTTR